MNKISIIIKLLRNPKIIAMLLTLVAAIGVNINPQLFENIIDVLIIILGDNNAN